MMWGLKRNDTKTENSLLTCENVIFIIKTKHENNEAHFFNWIYQTIHLLVVKLQNRDNVAAAFRQHNNIIRSIFTPNVQLNNNRLSRYYALYYYMRSNIIYII